MSNKVIIKPHLTTQQTDMGLKWLTEKDQYYSHKIPAASNSKSYLFQYTAQNLLGL